MSRDTPRSRQPFYGIIGNGHSCALISPEASIDWLCLPRFDSPSVLGKLLDPSGGHFTVESGEPGAEWTQAYLPRSAVLRSRCLGPGGEPRFSVSDWMPWRRRELRRTLVGEQAGRRVVIELKPALDYRRESHLWREFALSSRGVAFRCFVAQGTSLAIHLLAPAAAVVRATLPDPGEALRLELTLDRPVHLILTHAPPDTSPQVPADAPEGPDREQRWWSGWLEKSPYCGPFLEEFQRSLITMKLLTCPDSGAILAAATTSLAQHPGTGSGYDYRLAWVRDGAYAASAFACAGMVEEAAAFVDFLFRVQSPAPGAKPWQPAYALDGNPDCSERELWHLAGFLGDTPVRTGNDAFRQIQNDAEGEVLEALWDTYLASGDPDLLRRHWEGVARAADYVVAHWRDVDSGLWELRGVTGHYTHSKAMGWVALDRAVRIAQALGKGAEIDRWRREQPEISRQFMERGYNPRLKSFTLAYDTPIVDSSALVLGLHGLLSPEDPRWRSTLRRIEQDLVRGQLVARNPLEPVPFQLVTLWLARVYLMAGQPQRAQAVVEAVLAGATDLGLCWEHVWSDAQLPRQSPLTLARCGRDLLWGHRSLGSAARLGLTLWRYLRHRNPTTRKVRSPRLRPEGARLFRGNFPQLFSHEGLVRTLLALAPPAARRQKPTAAASIDLDHTVR